MLICVKHETEKTFPGSTYAAFSLIYWICWTYILLIYSWNQEDKLSTCINRKKIALTVLYIL